MLEIINYLENLSQDEISLVGTTGQVAVLKEGTAIEFFDNVEDAQNYVNNYIQENN